MQPSAHALARSTNEATAQLSVSSMVVLYPLQAHPELFAQADIDGGLVGGASLKPDFGAIVNYNK